MKTVIVFDSDEKEGMKNTVKIVNLLAKEYLDGALGPYDMTFGKIELIKQFRKYATLSNEEGFGSLRHAKGYVEKIIKDKTPF